MGIPASSLKRQDLANQTLEEHASRLCQLARNLEERGEYEAAAEKLRDFWSGLHTRPVVENFSPPVQAEILLRAGTLAGWLGGERQEQGAQEQAKYLIGESLALFESLALPERVGEAQTEMAYCYWREGLLNRAHRLLEEALTKLLDPNLRAVAIIRLGIVIWTEAKFTEAIDLLSANARLFDQIDKSSIRGRFSASLASFYFHQGSAESNEALIDRALIEYEAAQFYFEQARHKSYLAAVENQLGLIFVRRGKYAQAQEHLGRARKIYKSLKDRVRCAQVDETRARAFLAEGHYLGAEERAMSAVAILRDGHSLVLSDSLLTLAVAQARLGRMALAHLHFKEALARAEQAGAKERAAEVSVTALEELLAQESDHLKGFYESAARYAPYSSNPAVILRWNRIVELFEKMAPASDPPPADDPASVSEKRLLRVIPDHEMEWSGFLLGEIICRIEECYIDAALRQAAGSISTAARFLGFPHQDYLRTKLRNYPHLNLEARWSERRQSILKT